VELEVAVGHTVARCNCVLVTATVKGPEDRLSYLVALQQTPMVAQLLCVPAPVKLRQVALSPSHLQTHTVQPLVELSVSLLAKLSVETAGR
jgi:hypothetical protein